MDTLAQFPTLLGPTEMAGLTLKNRIVMPPMATAMQVGSDQFHAWYEARAQGGVALIIMEALWAQRLCDDEFCEKLEPTVEAIHDRGIPVVLQIFQPSVSLDGEPFAPSATDDARAATEDELAEAPGRFAEAAARSKEIGFDGVEPHGCHGFFLNQMFSPLRNRREDKYGGTPEKRMTLALEIVAAIRHEVGGDYPVFYRHTAEEPDGYSPEDSISFLGKLLDAGVDVLDISPSTSDLPPRGFHRENVKSDDDSSGAPELAHCDLAAAVKQALSAPVIAVGGMEDPEMAEAALREGKCDLCAVGRQLIADADWPKKVIEDRMDAIIHCVKCDIKCFGNLADGIPIGCVENPRSGNEYKMV